MDWVFLPRLPLFVLNLTFDSKEDGVIKVKAPSQRHETLMNSTLQFRDAAPVQGHYVYTHAAQLTCIHLHIFTYCWTLWPNVWIKRLPAINNLYLSKYYIMIIISPNSMQVCMWLQTEKKRRFCFVACPDSSNQNKITQTSWVEP